MKAILLVMLAVIGLTSCGNSQNANAQSTTKSTEPHGQFFGEASSTLLDALLLIPHSDLSSRKELLVHYFVAILV